MARKNVDFSHIDTAARNFRGYVYICIAISAGLALYFATSLREEDRWDRDTEEFVGSLVMFAIAIFYLVISNELFLKPLKAHDDWVERNGIFSSRLPESVQSGSEKDINIIRGEKLRSFSVADELMKWAKLRESGLISEKEYNEARRKLLQ